MAAKDTVRQCRSFHIQGTVQGVGFRPFVYRLATRLGVCGMVRNDGQGVEIQAWAAPETLDEFAVLLEREAPPLAMIRSVDVRELPVSGGEPVAFSIGETATGCTAGVAGGAMVDCPVDTAVCAACLAEMRDPADRRFGHAFINCTDCGPRYSIVVALPYDRRLTAMAGFAPCPQCAAEYGNPASRRFHAQPVCCPQCGPHLSLLDRTGKPLPSADPLASCIELLEQGGIAAIKGIGGFHLACRADSEMTVARLRRLKNREEKPLALMVADMQTASSFVLLSVDEERLLESPERPIVLARKRPDPRFAVADSVAPGLPTFGVMLPTAPLHHLLFDRSDFPALVMTSANRSDEPMVHTDERAIRSLEGIAELFLTHDRPIVMRIDDSVVRVAAGAPLLLRRARGYVPDPIPAPCDVTGIVGCGGVLKSTIAVGRGSACTVSQYVGSAENAETLEQAATMRFHLLSLLGTTARLYVLDRYPGTPLECIPERGVPTVRIQHHHAHAAACLAENGFTGRALCVVYDGTGFGDDGTLWGGEFFLADRYRFERVGHLSPMLLPGGEAAIMHPWRAALGALFPLLGDAAASLFPVIPAAEKLPVLELLSRRLHCIPSSGMGRLFDAMSALLMLALHRGYEGRPAVLLEAAAMASPGDRELPGYTVPLTRDGSGMPVIDGARILMEALTEYRSGAAAGRVAARFHASIAEATAAVAAECAAKFRVEAVCLSGGCFQNVLLTERTVHLLHKGGLTPLRHRLLPPSDEAVSFGQVVIAGMAGAQEVAARLPR